MKNKLIGTAFILTPFIALFLYMYSVVGMVTILYMVQALISTILSIILIATGMKILNKN